MQKSILIISSDKLDADGMKARLSSELTTVYIASNVEEAIGFFSKGKRIEIDKKRV